ncbi:MAG TPA: hypothetical protein VM694_28570 [Polyangium sp.]|nr:hypothetical protein [Polyangium sp.]
MRSMCRILSASLLVLAAACSGGGGDSGSASGEAGGGGSAGSGGGGPGSGGSGAGGGGALGGPFRHGVNAGHRHPTWSDPELAKLAREAGADSQRISLPEQHLETWGYEIEVEDIKQYAALGMSNHVAFLTTPTAEHSTAPAGTPNWQVAEYIPKNLYQPVFLADGKINPDNYWGAYVYKTVSTYKGWVKVWEVWNEPDWVADWQVTVTWDKDPPTKEQLPRFHGSIFDYVRMLRVTREAALEADPDAKIALGGIGYPNFLSAVLRYTDNPEGGAVTAAYPEKGATYFDVLSFHYYPVFSPGSSDVGVRGLVDSKNALAKVLDAAGVSGKTWMVTESGAPHELIGAGPGGVEYARNYILKVMTTAQAEGIGGVDWYLLTDSADLGASTSSFDYMGLYYDVLKLGAPTEAKLTDTGVAYRTHGALLAGASFDAGATAALALPEAVGGAAFKLSNGKAAFVLWAKTSGTAEDASAMYSLAASGPLKAYAWDHGKTGAATDLTPAGGSVSLSLTGSPQIFVAQ